MLDKKTIFVFKGIVFNEKNEILIDNRCEKELKEADGKWELPGGKIEFGESPEETVKREVLEETGFVVEVKKLIPYSNVSVWKYKECLQHTVVFSYICELKDNNCKINRDKRVNMHKWINKNDIDNYHFLPGAKEAIIEAIKIKESI